ncbi:MAG TPA: ABC transporter permease [Gemmatimonadaceae bacterium]|nr:ABC transporter permease [Gemmatimonadaceae bacterium]
MRTVRESDPKTGWLQGILIRTRALFGRRGMEQDLHDELQYHVERETDKLVAQGMTMDAARREALRRFGGIERHKEACRDERGVRIADEIRQDLGFAARSFARAPVFALTVVLTLTLGIGATTAIFTAVRGVLLRQLPFDQPEQLVRLWTSIPARDVDRGATSLPNFEDWRRDNRSFSRMAAYSTIPSGLVITDGGEPTRYSTAFVTEDFFATLGIRTQLGRVILPTEHAPGENRVVILSDALWRSRFNGDPAIVGRVVRMNDEPFVVVGVLSPGMRFPDGTTDLWAPQSVVPESGIPRTRQVPFLKVVARLAPGVTFDRARSDLATIARRLAVEYRETNEGSTIGMAALRDEIVGGSRSRILIVFGAVSLVLLLACVNVATLFLARASGRSRELAVRAALGAGRGRLVRQLITESLVLALVAGVLGVSLAWWGAAKLTALAGAFLPGDADVHPDWMVLLFGAALSILTGLAFGLFPATRGLLTPGVALHGSGRALTTGVSTQRLRALFVGAQVALAVLLVTGAGLLVKSFARLQQEDLGFNPDGLLVARLTIPRSRYETQAEYLPAAARMTERIGQLPGVTSVAMIKDAPLQGAGEGALLHVVGRETPEGQEPAAQLMPVSPEYFRTMAIPLIAGRDLQEQDADSGRFGAVISQRLAEQLWPGRSAVGERIAFGPAADGDASAIGVVGVVGDARYTRVDSAPMPIMYLPQGVMTRRIVTIVARVDGDPRALVPAMRDAIREVDKEQPITSLEPMSDIVAQAMATPRFLTGLVALFGLLALVLAAIGIYGVVAYVVGWRTREIGIRVALGARADSVVRWALWSGMAPVLAGLAVGVAVALVWTRLLSEALYEVRPTDPAVFTAVLGLLGLVSIVAAGIPALRAARVDPITALREE